MCKRLKREFSVLCWDKARESDSGNRIPLLTVFMYLGGGERGQIEFRGLIIGRTASK